MRFGKKKGWWPNYRHISGDYVLGERESIIIPEATVRVVQPSVLWSGRRPVLGRFKGRSRKNMLRKKTGLAVDSEKG